MTPEWTEADKLRLRRSRLRADAQSALEQRFANPDDPVRAAMLDSLIRDVYDTHRAWVDAVQEAR